MSDPVTKSAATKVLVVDDDEAMREVLRMRLEGWGFEVRSAGDGGEAERELGSFEPEIVVSDVVMPGLSGIELLKLVKDDDRDRPVLLITSHGTIDLAVEAMKEGAEDFLTKPLDYRQLRSTLDALAGELEERRSSRRRASELAATDGEGCAGLVGSSEAMGELCRLIREVAPTDASVLITGESGTGKEVTARALHRLGPRSGEELVAVNCAAIPAELMESEIFGHEKGAFTGATTVRRGCFELAHGSTLFLDEIAEMPLALQPKLLRVLEDGRVRRLGGSREHELDVRVVAATNQDPQRAVEEGRLREDLFYRLNVFHLPLPPLRERREDLPLLAQHFLGELDRRHRTRVEGLREETLELMRAYPWPGNVRELRNVMERAVVLAKEGWIEPSHLPPYLRDPDGGEVGKGFRIPPGTTLAEAEKALILQTLEETENNKSEAARRLGITPKTIYNKLKSYGLEL